jgi:hypothetical protein
VPATTTGYPRISTRSIFGTSRRNETVLRIVCRALLSRHTRGGWRLINIKKKVSLFLGNFDTILWCVIKYVSVKVASIIFSAINE